MVQSPSYIHLRVQWQLLGPESPRLRFERERFQKFLATLNSDPRTGDYDDFSYRADRCELGKLRERPTEGGQAFSKVVYANDQLTVVEEWAEISAEDFGKKFTGILVAWFTHFPETAVIMERCWLRALVQPRHFQDSCQFLGDRVLRLGEHLAAQFVQMPHRVGFTVGCVRTVQDAQLAIDTKVNSWRDNRSVWVEVGGAVMLRRPINATNPEYAQLPFTACKDFLEHEVVALLNRFDVKSGQSGGGQQ